jgi:hypothetical protein
VWVTGSAQVVVANSSLLGKPTTTHGAFINANGGTPRLDVERSVIAGNNGSGISAMTDGAGEQVRVVASHNKLANNASGGVYAYQAAGASTVVVLNGNVVSGGIWGVRMEGVTPPTVFSRGDNTLTFNSSGDVSGGSLTPLAGQ